MPYIDRKQRQELDDHIAALGLRLLWGDPGELNYAITKLVLLWLGTEAKYADYNAAIGVLECAKQEFYRVQVARYEDYKRVENGPVT